MVVIPRGMGRDMLCSGDRYRRNKVSRSGAWWGVGARRDEVRGGHGQDRATWAIHEKGME